jgi:hypothetical protein
VCFAYFVVQISFVPPLFFGHACHAHASRARRAGKPGRSATPSAKQSGTVLVRKVTIPAADPPFLPARRLRKPLWGLLKRRKNPRRDFVRFLAGVLLAIELQLNTQLRSE